MPWIYRSSLNVITDEMTSRFAYSSAWLLAIILPHDSDNARNFFSPKILPCAIGCQLQVEGPSAVLLEARCRKVEALAKTKYLRSAAAAA